MANIVTSDNIMTAKPEETVLEAEAEVVPVPVSVSEHQEQMNDLKRMKVYFDSRPKVSIYIPDNADEHVLVNGYSFHLKRGEQVEVPVDIADILRVSWKARGRANDRRQIETQSF